MGRPATEDELIDVSFALTATAAAQREAPFQTCSRATSLHKLADGRRRDLVVALNMLLCLGLVLFVLTQHTSPY